MGFAVVLKILVKANLLFELAILKLRAVCMYLRAPRKREQKRATKIGGSLKS